MKRKFVKIPSAIACLLMLLGSADSQDVAPHHDVSNDIVWTWSSHCGSANKLGIEVRFKDKVLYRGELAICRGSRETEDGRAEFYFSGDYVFQNEYRTRPFQKIEGNIWQAGGELDALILGIDFATKKRILLNTLYVAKPDRQASTEIDEGVFVKTFPIPQQHVQ